MAVFNARSFISNYWVIIVITTVGFLLRILSIFTDPFLHPWDERYHALVSKNLIQHPFKPMLRVNPITDHFDPFAWCCNHIWLHKQPLFMWQMAVSMKLFGVSEWAMRLPSVILGTIMIVVLYRMANLLTQDKKTALISAGLLSVSFFHLNMIAGAHGMDHNDIAHGFYILLSIWTYSEYFSSKKVHWALLTGLFAGAAILNKWLTGLIIFLPWFILYAVRFKRQAESRSEFLHIILALLVCCLVFIPWQIYILHHFPELANYEYQYNIRHITEVLGGHSGDVFFYFVHLADLTGPYLFYFIPAGLVVLYYSVKSNKDLLLSFFLIVIATFAFFSIIVKTKVETYLFICIPISLIFIAASIRMIMVKMKAWPINLLVVSIAIILSFQPLKITGYLSIQNTKRQDRIYNAEIYRKLKSLIPPEYKVVMNMNAFEDIDVMFYNDDLTAYHFTLTENDFMEFERKKLPIAVFEEHDKYKLPDYVKTYPYLFIIKKQLKTFHEWE